jgi:hypothetical protein
MQSQNTGSRRSSRTILVSILLVAALTRLSLLYVNHQQYPRFFFPDTERIHESFSDPTRPSQNPFGYEVSNVAHALVCAGEGFGSPFGGGTGPTGWVAPGAVAFYALPFALFGCFTTGSTLFAFAMALGLSLATAYFVFRIGNIFLEDPRGGLLAAFLFAIGPGDTHLYMLPSQLDFNLPTFFVALIFLTALGFYRKPTTPGLVAFASSSAVGALFQPNLILCGAVGIVFLLAVGDFRHRLKHLLIFGIIHVAILGPFIGYQRHALGGWFFIKSNAPFELYQGNTETARGTLNNTVFTRHHPSQALDEFVKYRELGELSYVRMKSAEFLEDFDARRFALSTARRFAYYFFLYNEQWHDYPGPKLVAKRVFSAVPGVTLLLYLILRWRRFRMLDGFLYLYIGGYALPYLATGYMTRYTVPVLTCVMVLLADLLLQLPDAVRRVPSGKRGSPP